SSQYPGTTQPKTALRFRKAVSGASSAGALRNRSCGAFLATGPRELKRSACANAEAAPKVMVQQKVPSHSAGDLFGAPSWTRTQDPLIKSQLLSQLTNTNGVVKIFHVVLLSRTAYKFLAHGL